MATVNRRRTDKGEWRYDVRYRINHDLRHAAGTLAAQTGATQRELMARLGHATPSAAQRYQHGAERRDADIAAGLDRMVDTARRRPSRPEQPTTNGGG